MSVVRSKPAVWIVTAAAILATAVILARPRPASHSSAEVISAGFEVWSVYDGTIDSRSVKNVMSDLWNATVVDIVPDGAQVSKDDVLIRFDASNYERELPRAERDYATARTDLDGLVNAKLPLELAEIDSRLTDARQKLSEETQALDDSRELLKEKLISEQEVRQQEIKVAASRALAGSLEQQLELTRKYLHPSTVERAKAALAGAEIELNRIKASISKCVVCAPVDGKVIYKVIPIGADVRTIRVGDTVYKNQTLMTIPDMSNLVMRCDVPESDITRINTGNDVLVQPLAYPDISFKGTVESISAMAQSIPGRPAARKYFGVIIRLDKPDDRLRSGMSARARILSYSRRNAVLIPRTAVWWEDSTPWCNVQRGSEVLKTQIKIGMANDTRFEVIEGLKPGDRVITR